MIHAIRRAGSVALVIVLAGCSSAPTHFHTLVPPVSTVAMPTTAPFLIDVPSVGVPTQVDQPSLVLRHGSTGVSVLDGERWASPLGDEIRGALSADLSTRLGTHDVNGLPRAKDARVVRIQLDVRRFDSEVGGNATLEAGWSVRLADHGAVACASRVSEPAGGSYDSLVEAHQRAIGTVADQIAVVARSLAAGQTTNCP